MSEQISTRQRATKWLDENAITDGDCGDCSMIIDSLENEIREANKQARAEMVEGLLRERIRGMSLKDIAEIKGLNGLAIVGKPYIRPAFHAKDE